MEYNIYEYTSGYITIIIKALNKDDAHDILVDKCKQEDIMYPLKENMILISSENDCSGVIAYIDGRK